jgi:hypothetical protein
MEQNQTLRLFFAVTLILLMVLSNLIPFVSTVKAAEKTDETTEKVLFSTGSTGNYLNDGPTLMPSQINFMYDDKPEGTVDLRFNWVTNTDMRDNVVHKFYRKGVY